MQVGRASVARGDRSQDVFRVDRCSSRDRQARCEMGIKGVEYQALRVLDNVIDDDRSAKKVIDNIYNLAIEQGWHKHAGS